MHQPDIQARASLYFPYQVYPYFASKEATYAAADTVTIALTNASAAAANTNAAIRAAWPITVIKS